MAQTLAGRAFQPIAMFLNVAESTIYGPFGPNPGNQTRISAYLSPTMNRVIFCVLLASLAFHPGCQRATCPAYDGLSAEMNGTKQAKTKAPKPQSGLYGKNGPR
jgi:hypothetical protein